MKKCSKCKMEKDEMEFRNNTKADRQAYCKPCQDLSSKEWNKKNREKVRESRFKCFYKLSREEYNALLIK